MTPESLRFLKLLLDTPGPSSFEAAPARVWRAEAEKFAQAVHADVAGNSYAALEGNGSPRLMLAGHIDEIGVMVTHIDDEGFLSFDTIGGWDHQVFVGQRIVLLGRQGNAEIRAEELAEKIGTIPYEVVSRINPLISRRLV